MLINENWKIESDEWNCTLYHRNTGAKEWRAISYYGDPRECLERMAKFEIFGTGFKDFETVCKKIDELNALVKTIKTLPALLESAPAITKVKKSAGHRADAVKQAALAR